MEKEKYEKPEFEIINLLNEVFTEDSQNPEDTDDDPFKDDEEEEMDAVNLLQELGEGLDAFLAEDGEGDEQNLKNEDHSSDNENPEIIEEENEDATPTDESTLNEDLDIFSELEEQIIEESNNVNNIVDESVAIEENIEPETSFKEPSGF